MYKVLKETCAEADSYFVSRCDDYPTKAPRAMLSLDMMLPPSYQVDTWGLLDPGQLGPAARYNTSEP